MGSRLAICLSYIKTVNVEIGHSVVLRYLAQRIIELTKVA